MAVGWPGSCVAAALSQCVLEAAMANDATACRGLLAALYAAEDALMAAWEGLGDGWDWAMDRTHDFFYGPYKDFGDMVREYVSDPTIVSDLASIAGNAGLSVLAGGIVTRNPFLLYGGGVLVGANCGVLAGWISDRLGGKTYVVGSFIFSPYEPLPEVLQHEMAHVTQYEVLGKWFLPVYGVMEFGALVSCGFDADCAGGRHPLEILADWQAGTDVR